MAEWTNGSLHSHYGKQSEWTLAKKEKKKDRKEGRREMLLVCVCVCVCVEVLFVGHSHYRAVYTVTLSAIESPALWSIRLPQQLNALAEPPPPHTKHSPHHPTFSQARCYSLFISLPAISSLMQRRPLKFMLSSFFPLFLLLPCAWDVAHLIYSEHSKKDENKTLRWEVSSSPAIWGFTEQSGSEGYSAATWEALKLRAVSDVD